VIETFRQFFSGLVPAYLRARRGGTMLEAVGMALDDATQTLVEGLRASLPLLAEEDALTRIGKDRKLPRLPTETKESYAYRLSIFRQLGRHSASQHGQLLSLQPYFLPGSRPMIRIVHQDGSGSIATWHTIDASGVYSVHHQSPSNWNWDQNFTRWSRFWVIVYVDAEVGPVGAEWDDGCEWDDGTIWDGYLNEAQIADMLELVNTPPTPHSVCAGIILARDPASFDPTGAVTAIGDGTFTHPSGDWDRVVRTATGLPVRLATASYAYEDESALP
jgi:hypothetical protein